MREIKFRAWDARVGAYVIPAHTMNIHTGQISDLPDRFILEQFTGLHDKNGKEIYEGDILSHGYGPNGYGVVQFSKGLFGINWDYAKNHDPDWEHGSLFGGWGNEHNLRKMGDGFNREMEVLGNIHENPELLNAH